MSPLHEKRGYRSSEYEIIPNGEMHASSVLRGRLLAMIDDEDTH